MTRAKILIMKLGGIVASFALAVGISTVGTNCVCWFHQPKVPDKLLKRDM